MTISSRLRLLLARANVERATQGEPSLSLRRLSEESGVSLSVLAALHTGRSQRIDYSTIDNLLVFFNRYFHVTAGDLLAWEQSPEGEPHTTRTGITGSDRGAKGGYDYGSHA